MNVQHYESYEALSEAAADLVLKRLEGTHKRMLCAATGGSPTGMYAAMATRKHELSIANLTILKLDEWYQLPMDLNGTCEVYLQQHVIKPLSIPMSNYISFDSMAPDPDVECKRIQDAIATQGAIDVCILGIGLNGHLALNEPAQQLEPGVHLGALAESSKSHPLISESDFTPTHGFTLGIGDILKARTIVLLVNGKKKKTIFSQLMDKKVSTLLPASLLWLHPDAYCFYTDQD
ncbi:MAG TPA: 6-phosphogluconolactonase [Flavitalea sp.]|nr:6-phosphogluconolactonase [Flavitalea sp.]